MFKEENKNIKIDIGNNIELGLNKYFLLRVSWQFYC